MTKSESIKEIASALCKAQGQMRGAKKDTANPFFKSRYADLAAVWEAVRGPLSDNGLSVVQRPTSDASGLVLETMILHSSGEYLTSDYPITPVKNDPQGVGSAITYARRYALMAMVGVAAEDDDGEAAMGRRDDQREQSARRVATAQAPVAPPASSTPRTWHDTVCHVGSKGGVLDRKLGTLKLVNLKEIEAHLLTKKEKTKADNLLVAAVALGIKELDYIPYDEPNKEEAKAEESNLDKLENWLISEEVEPKEFMLIGKHQVWFRADKFGDITEVEAGNILKDLPGAAAALKGSQK